LPLIGITSQLIPASKWYKEVAQFGVRAVEINRPHSQLYFNLYSLQRSSYIAESKRRIQEIRLGMCRFLTGVTAQCPLRSAFRH